MSTPTRTLVYDRKVGMAKGFTIFTIRQQPDATEAAPKPPEPEPGYVIVSSTRSKYAIVDAVTPAASTVTTSSNGSGGSGITKDGTV